MSKNQVLEMCDSATRISVWLVFFFEFNAEDACLVNLFRSILPVAPTECDVLIVGNIMKIMLPTITIMTIIVHFTIEHYKYIMTGNLKAPGKMHANTYCSLADWMLSFSCT